MLVLFLFVPASFLFQGHYCISLFKCGFFFLKRRLNPRPLHQSMHAAIFINYFINVNKNIHPSTQNHLQWSYILLVVHYSVFVMLNAGLCDFLFLGRMFSIFLLAFICTKYNHYLCMQNPLNQFLPHVSTIPTNMRYSFAVLSKFVCAISNFQNKCLFCVLVPLMKQ